MDKVNEGKEPLLIDINLNGPEQHNTNLDISMTKPVDPAPV